MPTTWGEIEGPAGGLALHVAPGSPTRAAQANVLVLCHGFPVERDSAERVADTLPMLADRIAAENGCPVVVGCLRGVGASAGDFSLGGWYDDLRVLVDHAAEIAHGGGVWIVGFGTGGALGLCVAGEDARVRGVACFGSPATFSDWANEGVGMIEYARRVGAIRTEGFPSDRRAWVRRSRSCGPMNPQRSCPRGRCSSYTAPTTRKCPSPTDGVWPSSPAPAPSSGFSPERATACVPIPAPSRCWQGGSNVRGPERRCCDWAQMSQPASTCSRLSRIDDDSAAAARFGSSASVRKRTTTKWRAPAIASSGTVSGVTPPVTNTGRRGLGHGKGDVGKPGSGSSRLRRRRCHGASRDIVDGFFSAGLELNRSMGGKADDGRGPQNAPRQRGGGVVLADVDTVCPDLEGEVGSVVHDERHTVLRADPCCEPTPLDQVPCVEVLVPQLDDVHASCDARVQE